jgi:hypothetical protein
MKNKRSNVGDRLGTYLTAAVGIGTLAGTADAAIVDLDVSTISALNGGVAPGAVRFVNFSTLGGPSGTIVLYNYTGYAMGISGKNGAKLAVDGAGNASPHRFTLGQQIDASAQWVAGDPPNTYRSLFYHYYDKSPDFGANSFMGFRSTDNKYGWLEVTWNGSTEEFYIVSGAYEDSGNSIKAGADSISAIPEPASVLSTMGLLASGLMIRRRKLAA